MEPGDPDTCGRQFLDRLVQLTVVGVESEATALVPRGAFTWTMGFKVPVDAQAHREGGRWELAGKLCGPGNLALGVQVDNRSGQQGRFQTLTAFDGAVVHNAFGCV